MVDHLQLLRRPNIPSLTHCYTEIQSHTQIYQMYPRALWFLSLCVFITVCGHIFAFACTCAFTLGHAVYALICSCVFVYGYILWVGGEQAAERQRHKRHRIKLDLTVSLSVGGKFDCSLQVVWGFDISSSPLFDNTLDKTRFTKIAKC